MQKEVSNRPANLKRGSLIKYLSMVFALIKNINIKHLKYDKNIDQKIKWADKVKKRGRMLYIAQPQGKNQTVHIYIILIF